MKTSAKYAKRPQQQRSVATVEAILQAAVQVLHRQGKAKLTTTRVAERAGVSVGTLYQYFPNKTALLQEALRRHLDTLADAMEQACEEAKGQPLSAIAHALADAWTKTKLRTITASVALYAVVDAIEGRPIAVERSQRMVQAMAAAFRTAPDSSIVCPELVAQTLLGALSGISRDMLDPAATPAHRDAMAEQLCVVVMAYVSASGQPVHSPSA